MMQHIKKRLKIALRWLTWSSLKKNFSLLNLLISVLPAAAAYLDFLPRLLPPNQYSHPEALRLFIAFAVLALLCVIDVYERYVAYEQAIADVLATGYFYNFIDNAARMFNEKSKGGSNIEFFTKDKTEKGSKPGTSAMPNDIEVRIILPASLSALTECQTEIGRRAVQMSTDDNTRIHVKTNNDGSATIYECPRTLLAIKKYFLEKDPEYPEERSFKMHEHFNRKVNTLWEMNSEHIPVMFKRYKDCDKPMPSK
jgi:hypothetical protein